MRQKTDSVKKTDSVTTDSGWCNVTYVRIFNLRANFQLPSSYTGSGLLKPYMQCNPTDEPFKNGFSYKGFGLARPYMQCNLRAIFKLRVTRVQVSLTCDVTPRLAHITYFNMHLFRQNGFFEWPNSTCVVIDLHSQKLTCHLTQCFKRGDKEIRRRQALRAKTTILNGFTDTLNGFRATPRIQNRLPYGFSCFAVEGIQLNGFNYSRRDTQGNTSSHSKVTTFSGHHDFF